MKFGLSIFGLQDGKSNQRDSIIYLHVHVPLYIQTYTHLIYKADPGLGALLAGYFLTWAPTPSWELGPRPGRSCGRPKGAMFSKTIQAGIWGHALQQKGFCCTNHQLLSLSLS